MDNSSVRPMDPLVNLRVGTRPSLLSLCLSLSCSNALLTARVQKLSVKGPAFGDLTVLVQVRA